jgi:spore maturation protein CgeB
MRLMRIGSVYPAYWKRFYAQRPGLESKPYAEQAAALFYDAFSQSDSYCHYLRQMGYECEEVIGNVEPLQRQWAQENGAAWDIGTYASRHSLEMAKQFKPEIVFINDFNIFNAQWIGELRAVCASVRLVVGWCGIDVASAEPLQGCDIVLTSSPVLLAKFQGMGLRVALLRHAFDPRILHRIGVGISRDIPLSFVGNVIRARDFHDYRGKVIERLLGDFEVALYCPSRNAGAGKVLAQRMLFEAARLLRGMGVPNTAIEQLPLLRRVAGLGSAPRFSWCDSIAQRSRGEVYGLEMFRVLARSQITLNAHIAAAGNSTGNIRLFEGPGMGACLLTDWKEDMEELFDIEKEVAVYRSPDECADKARWLLANPDRCAEIGAAGQRRVLKDHTYANRVGELDRIFRKELS